MLVPTGDLDWRVRPTYNINNVNPQEKHAYTWATGDPFPAEISDGSFATGMNDLRVLQAAHGRMDCRDELPGPHIGCSKAVPPLLQSCIFHTLFQPSMQLAALVRSLREQLFGSATEPYVAVHLRIGGFEGERGVVRGGLGGANHTTTEAVVSALRAAQQLAAGKQLPAPVLVLTDNDALRRRLRSGELPGFISTPFMAKHAAKVGQHDSQAKRHAMLTSFADLMLLSQASCLVGSPSGFTRLALIWGRHDCFLLANGDGKGWTVPVQSERERAAGYH